MNGYHEFGKPGPETERTIREIESGNPEPTIAGERIPLRNTNSPYPGGSPPIVEPTLDEFRKLILLGLEWDGRTQYDH